MHRHTYMYTVRQTLQQTHRQELASSLLNSDLSNTGTLNATERHRHAQILTGRQREIERAERHIK